MAKGKGWGKSKDPKPEKSVENTADQGQEQGGIEADPTVGETPIAASPTGFDTPEEDNTPSCMNGCPHYFPTPQAGGKYSGLCRRYPPIPSGNARFFAWPIVINHPVSGFPKYPICGEHPIFQQGRATGHKSPISFDLATG